MVRGEIARSSVGAPGAIPAGATDRLTRSAAQALQVQTTKILMQLAGGREPVHAGLHLCALA
jgi:hypothetical protein